MWCPLFIFILSAQSNLYYAKPTEVDETKISMYDMVLQKCPAIANTSIANHTEFKNCTDWAAINGSYTFSTGTIQNLRCLLYYDALVSFCTKAGDLLAMNPSIVDDKNIKLDKNIDMAHICNPNSSLFVDQGGHNWSKITDGNRCYGLCMDTDNGFITDSFCSKAYYFATFKVDALKKIIFDSVNAKLPQDNKTAEKTSNKQSVIDPNLNLNSEKKTNENPNPEPNPIQAQPEVNLSVKPEANADMEQLSEKVNEMGKVGVNAAEGQAEPNSAAGSNPVLSEDVRPIVVQKPSTPIPKVVTGVAAAPKTEVEAQKPSVVNEAPAAESNVNNPPIEEQGKPVFDPDDEDGDTLNDDDVYEDPNIKAELNNVNINGKVEQAIGKSKPEALIEETIGTTGDIPDGESNFFSYFMVMMCVCIVGYVGYHNKQKILALVLEGRHQRGRRSQRGGRRPNSANYHKLDSNLEEAMSSSVKKSASNIIY